MTCACENLLGPVWSQHGGKLEIVDRVFAALQDGDDLEGVSRVLVEEALWTAEMRRDGWRVRVLLAGEDKELESCVGGREILYVHFPRVGGAHEEVREKALADD